MIERLVLSAAFKAVVPGIPGELGSIPRRSRHLKKSVNANILAFTDDILKNYEQIPVQHLLKNPELAKYDWEKEFVKDVKN